MLRKFPMIKWLSKLKDISLNAYNKKNSVSTRGGYVNFNSGAGFKNDKTLDAYFTPTFFRSRDELSIIFSESWSAKKITRIPIDDQFIRWRYIEDLTPDESKKYNLYQEEFSLKEKLNRLMINGRIYGTSFLVFITDDDLPDRPLKMERLREGSLKNMFVVDRYYAQIEAYNYNLYDKNYGNPEIYRFTLPNWTSINVHHSRVIRYDGVKPISNVYSSSPYERDWGLSIYVDALKEIFRDEGLTKNTENLVYENSIPVVKTSYLRDSLENPGGAEVPMDVYSNEIAKYKSSYRTLYLNEDDEFTRVNIPFTGIPEIFDRFSKRLAAVADIPATRFWGQPPIGMNATGESDMANYAAMVCSHQENSLRPMLNFVDKIMIKTSGLNKEFKFSFPSLIDLSDLQRAQVFKEKSEGVKNVFDADRSVLSPDEARVILSGDSVVGDLDLTKSVGPAEDKSQPPINPKENNSDDDDESDDDNNQNNDEDGVDN